eukprot:tig00021012_g17002.t1
MLRLQLCMQTLMGLACALAVAIVSILVFFNARSIKRGSSKKPSRITSIAKIFMSYVQTSISVAEGDSHGLVGTFSAANDYDEDDEADALSGVASSAFVSTHRARFAIGEARRGAGAPKGRGIASIEEEDDRDVAEVDDHELQNAKRDEDPDLFSQPDTGASISDLPYSHHVRDLYILTCIVALFMGLLGTGVLVIALVANVAMRPYTIHLLLYAGLLLYTGVSETDTAATTWIIILANLAFVLIVLTALVWELFRTALSHTRRRFSHLPVMRLADRLNARIEKMSAVSAWLEAADDGEVEVSSRRRMARAAAAAGAGDTAAASVLSDRERPPAIATAGGASGGGAAADGTAQRVPLSVSPNDYLQHGYDVDVASPAKDAVASEPSLAKSRSPKQLQLGPSSSHAADRHTFALTVDRAHVEPRGPDRVRSFTEGMNFGRGPPPPPPPLTALPRSLSAADRPHSTGALSGRRTSAPLIDIDHSSPTPLGLSQPRTERELAIDVWAHRRASLPSAVSHTSKGLDLELPHTPSSPLARHSGSPRAPASPFPGGRGADEEPHNLVDRSVVYVLDPSSPNAGAGGDHEDPGPVKVVEI